MYDTFVMSTPLVPKLCTYFLIIFLIMLPFMYFYMFLLKLMTQHFVFEVFSHPFLCVSTKLVGIFRTIQSEPAQNFLFWVC